MESTGEILNFWVAQTAPSPPLATKFSRLFLKKEEIQLHVRPFQKLMGLSVPTDFLDK